MSTIKVELDASAARAIRDQWHVRASELECEAESLRVAIAAIDCQLNGELPLRPATAAAPAPGATLVAVNGSRKRKKGANLRTITGFVQGLAGKGATVAEVSKGCQRRNESGGKPPV
jgi:hypothetical protein